jgi:hypothetical protein
MALLRCIFCMLTVVALTLPAPADWQNTRWGMTTAELRAVNPNVTPTTGAERDGMSNPNVGEALYRSAYLSNEDRFTAYYLFRAGKLARVSLKLDDVTVWPRINRTLEQVYGRPTVDKSRQMSGPPNFCTITDRKWRDEKAHNQVSAFGLACQKGGQDFFSVDYEPVLTSTGTGL